MERNGEFEEYSKYHVPEALEHKWSKDILESLFETIYSGKDVWQVANLANVRIEEAEVFNAFNLLSNSPFKLAILSALEKEKHRIPPKIFEKIIEFFLH